MGEPARAEPVERSLPRVAERRMAQIVAERDGLGQVLVEPQRPGNGPGHLGHFQRVGVDFIQTYMSAGTGIVLTDAQKDASTNENCTGKAPT